MTSTRDRLRRSGAAVGVGLLAALAAWVRLGPVARGTAWAEDAGLFFREHLALGSAASVVEPYAGYLHVVPRLVVDVGFALPIAWYALTVTTLCCVLTGAACAGVFVLAADAVPSAVLRVVLAAVPVLLPTAPWEVLGNAANLHTTALLLAPWVFAHRARTRTGAVTLALVAVLVLTTEVQALLFLPLLLLAWVPGRDRARATGASAGRADAASAAVPPASSAVPSRRARVLRALPVTVAALGAGAAQVVTALTTDRDSPRGDPSGRDVASGYLLQTVGGLWRADLAAVGRAVVASGWWVVGVPAAVLVAIVVTAVVVGLRERRRRAVLLASALAVGSVVVWSAALLANASANGRWSRSDPGALLDATPSRYAAAAGMLLSAALVVSASVLVGHVLRSDALHATGTDAGTDAGTGTGTDATVVGGHRSVRVVRRALGWTVVAVLAATWVAAFPGTAQRATGPEWYPQVVAAEARCRQDPAGTVMIGALPWEARVPCVLVLGTGATGR
ncbi:hypothetical protein [Curtobacterium sp. MR_MD2014]|uniref:hypothetical protein n=1 Tax=Curtobacterium sp. MR_MD2014 TaxID=1561023 RepID=UPI00052A43C5|nr:hypothetical protein [Curtobacterium sp. MR_MD2014]AIV40447.1 hypothetical protein NI26_10260 [Curtobacterium sp. MR_MD2014]